MGSSAAAICVNVGGNITGTCCNKKVRLSDCCCCWKRKPQNQFSLLHSEREFAGCWEEEEEGKANIISKHISPPNSLLLLLLLFLCRQNYIAFENPRRAHDDDDDDYGSWLLRIAAPTLSLSQTKLQRGEAIS